VQLSIRVTLLFLFFCAVKIEHTLAQNIVDSLEKLLEPYYLHESSPSKITDDTNKVNLLLTLSAKYLYPDKAKALQYATEAMYLSQQLEFHRGSARAFQSMGEANYVQNKFDTALQNFITSSKKYEQIKDLDGLADVYGRIGNIYADYGNFNNALEFHFKAAKIKEEIEDKSGLGYTLDLIGSIYREQNMFKKALEYHFKAVKIKKEIGNQKGLAFTYDLIGRINRDQKNYQTALEYHLKASKIKKDIGNKMGLAYTLDQIGRLFREQKEYEKALNYHMRASEIKQEIGNKKGLAYTYDHIGNIYNDMGNSEVAVAYQLRAAKIKEEIGNKKGLAYSLYNIGKTYFSQGQPTKALEFHNKALETADEIGAKALIKDIYKEISAVYSSTDKYQKALNYFQLYTSSKDSIFNEESVSQMAEMQTKYETDKKEKEIEIQRLKLSTQDTELNKNRIIIFAFAGGFALVLILVIVAYRSYRLKRKANLLLERKNESILLQKQIIETKNTQITDSIDYAKRIQEAVLPDSAMIKDYFPDSFILYKPKAIVSGDFYWLYPKGDKILFAAADCTGHGVPGAFMSIIGNNILNQVVSNNGVLEPGAVLNLVNEEVISRLQQKRDDQGDENEASNWIVKDGMDIALCSLDTKTLKLEYAGAHNPLYIIRNGNLIETKADKLFIGGVSGGDEFTNHSSQLEKGDCIYIFSDGYADQRGGPDDKKFYYPPFQQLLIDNSSKNLDEQKDILDKTISDWMENNEQIDDILIFGVRV